MSNGTRLATRARTRAAQAKPRPCPCGCGQTVVSGRLLALSCWRGLPRILQHDVNSMWRAYKANRSIPTLQAYRSARDAAVDLAKRNRQADQP